MNKENIIKNMTMLMTGIIYVGIGFAAGFCLSQLMGSDTAPPAEAVSAVPTPLIPTLPPAPEPTEEVTQEDTGYYGVRYIVRADGDELYIYETDGSYDKMLRKSKINMNGLPQRDAKELANGITSGTLEDALEIWEGFVE